MRLMTTRKTIFRYEKGNTEMVDVKKLLNDLDTLGDELVKFGLLKFPVMLIADEVERLGKERDEALEKLHER